MVVFPHGGPMARDYADFDHWTEFFASRGLAVLQPNFRGSSGYGWEFEMAAVQNYGGIMQDDLTDGVHWLIEQGIALPDRIGIGASYGGQFGMDTEQLRNTSVEKIRIPILLAHGERDGVVPVEPSRQMAKALRKHGKQVIYLEFPGGGHGLELQLHRHELFQAMDVFLREHLLAPVAAAAAAAR